MIVQHNLLAMNANRQYGITNNKQAKTTEKLASGYRINRAADDAAGLAISEKMRRQIRGLTQASLNAQEGISMVQVADGALNEMHDILQRMNELSVKAANGTLSDEDRGFIQQEIDQLRTEVGRICTDTTYNEIPIFNYGDSLVKIDAPDYGNVPMKDVVNVNGNRLSNAKTMDFSGINANNINNLVGKSFSVLCSAGCQQEFKFEFVDNAPSSAQLTTGHSPDRPNIMVKINVTGMTSGADVVNEIYNQVATLDNDIVTQSGGSDISLRPGSTHIGHANGLTKEGAKLIPFGNSIKGFIKANDLDQKDAELPFQVGSEAGQTIMVNLFHLNPGKIGIGDVDVTTMQKASDSIDFIKGGLEKISQIRSYYGAVQNRFEHTVKNLDNVVENTTAAESAIRDTDMAKAMVDYSNNNILAQAGTSMLTQANQNNQNVLNLLS